MNSFRDEYVGVAAAKIDEIPAGAGAGVTRFEGPLSSGGCGLRVEKAGQQVPGSGRGSQPGQAVLQQLTVSGTAIEADA